jgi:trigger factor
MKVRVEDVSSVKKILHVEVPAPDVTKELDDAYNALKKTAKIKGFRPGKVPRSVLKRLYGKNIAKEVTSTLLQSSFQDAIQETQLNLIGTPEINPPELDPQGAYEYSATIEIRPEIDTIDFNGLELKRPLYRPSDEEIDTQLKMLQRSLGQKKRITEDRPARQDDFVLIDYEGYKDEKPFAETQKTENFTMKIGQNSIAKDIDEAIIGMQIGENKTVTVAFPKDHYNQKLAGLDITFHIQLNEIREEVLAQLDDAFAKQLGPYETIADVKAEIMKDLGQRYEKRADQIVQEQIFTALMKKTEFEVPETLVNIELDVIVDDIQRSLTMKNKSLEDEGLTPEGLREKYRPMAVGQVRRQLILGKLVEQEKLVLSAKELDAAIADMAKSAGHTFEELKQYYKENKTGLDYFKQTLLAKKAMKLIIDSSTIKDVVPEEMENDAANEKSGSGEDSPSADK